MPYRRLPNTDLARIRALKAAVENGDASLVSDLPISLHVLSEARSFLRKFEHAQRGYKQCYDAQIKESRKHQTSVKMARLYLSHFIQVLNLSIIRLEIKETFKKLYGLAAGDTSVPDLTTEAAIALWGKQIIEGEQKRMMQGGQPIYNPTIAKVRVHYDVFLDGYERQKRLQTLTTRSLNDLAAMRAQADKLILTIWNQVEVTYRDLTPDQFRLNKCANYGLIYYYRTDEKQNTSIPNDAD